MAKRPGRTRAAEARWRGALDDWRREGGSVQEFCRKRGVSEHGFYVWRRRLGEAKAAGSGEQARGAFLPVRVVSRGAPAGGVEVELPSGRVVRAGPLVEPEALARLVSLLDPRTC
jgi:transposase-like protein